MSRHCSHCESGKISKHKTFDGDEKWSCDSCSRIYIEAEENHVTDYNDISKGDLILK